MPSPISRQSTAIQGWPGSCAIIWRPLRLRRTSKLKASLGQRGRNRVGQRERTGQPRGFDAEELHQAEQPVILRGVDHKVRGRLAGTGELRTDARIIRDQLFGL